MREIKFRCWSKKHQIMWPWEMPNGEKSFDTDKELRNDDSVLMQFTGLKDKNGTPIWEGDILQDSPTYKGVCKYSDEKASFYIDRNEFGTGWRGYLLSSMEVLGNVYEHPHLLNSKVSHNE